MYGFGRKSGLLALIFWTKPDLSGWSRPVSTENPENTENTENTDSRKPERRRRTVPLKPAGTRKGPALAGPLFWCFLVFLGPGLKARQSSCRKGGEKPPLAAFPSGDSTYLMVSPCRDGFVGFDPRVARVSVADVFAVFREPWFWLFLVIFSKFQ